MRNLKYVLESSTDEIDYFLQNYNHEDFLDIIYASECYFVDKYKPAINYITQKIHLNKF